MSASTFERHVFDGRVVITEEVYIGSGLIAGISRSQDSDIILKTRDAQIKIKKELRRESLFWNIVTGLRNLVNPEI